jgi:hypothetical protein
MKALLLHRDRDFEVERTPQRFDRTPRKVPAVPSQSEIALVADLELEVLFAAMAGKDQLVYDVVRKTLLTGVRNDVDTILYRQQAVRDCLANPDVIQRMYAITNEVFQRQTKLWGFFRESPSGRLDYAVDVMKLYVDGFKRLRALADQSGARFKSEAFANLFSTLQRELSDAYFAVIDDHLKQLRFRSGVPASAMLGQGLRGIGYTLRRVRQPNGWLERIFGDGRRVYKIYLAPRDEAGANAMNELRDRGLALAAGALARSADHVVSFYYQLRTELAFYVGCLRVYERLHDLHAPFSFPSPTAAGGPRFACKDLYDISLALSANQRPVGNDINADGKPLIVVTGANQGGKTTFLRSFGLAQLMMQSGMFVAAAQLRANAVDGVFTHFRREEDASMKSGKFDEELGRMSDIVDVIAPYSLLLFNESFAATNEREGSEIARQIVTALLERPNKVAFVSHQFAFSHGLFESRRESTLFLRAERRDDGQRTFKLIEREPLSTSFGEDVYREVFADEEESDRTAALRLKVEALDIPPRAGVQL